MGIPASKKGSKERGDGGEFGASGGKPRGSGEKVRWQLGAALHLLRTRYPVDAALMGESGTVSLAMRAVQHAHYIGLDPLRGGLRYLELMVLLGVGFEIDPQLPFAHRVLEGSDDSEEQMDRLWKDSLAYLRAVAGHHGKLYRAAMRRAFALNSTALLSRWSNPSQASSLLQRVYPAKFETIADKQYALFDLAQERCREHDGKDAGVVPLYQLLMFLLGSDFEEDPRFAWAPATLAKSHSPPNDRYRALHDGARTAAKSGLTWLREKE
jgi:hypothetical protein